MKAIEKNIVILWLVALFITGCSQSSDEEFSRSTVNLDINVSLSDVSAPVTRGVDRYEGAVSKEEKIQTLRIIVVRPDGIVEHNRLLSLASAVEVYKSATFKVAGKETKRIYLFVNEGLTTKKNVVPESSVSSDKLPNFDFNTIIAGQPFPTDEIAALTIDMGGNTEELYGALPMSECHEVKVPEEDCTFNLFVTRAAVKFSFRITNQGSNPLKLAGLTIDKMAKQEYYLPKNTKYSAVNDKGGREIIEYDVPSNTGENNGYYTFNRIYDVSLPVNTQVVLDPIYLLESKYTNPAGSVGNDGITPLNYSMSISFAELGGEKQLSEYLKNLPLLPRNTHVVVNITIGDSKIDWSVDLEPYGEVVLPPIFGLDPEETKK